MTAKARRPLRWLAALTLVSVVGCMPDEIREHQAYINAEVETDATIAVANLAADDFNLHVRSAGEAKGAVVLWIHGTPGGWSDIGRLMRNVAFLERAKLVSIDRPGWGESQFDPPRVVPTFAEHSALIKPLLKRLKLDHPGVPLVVVGHSWGAPLLPTLGLDHPDLIDGLIALSGPFDANLAQPRWYNRAASLPGINTLIGYELRASNDEMYALPDELSAESERWPELATPLWIIHGAKDSLVTPAHIDYARAQFGEALEHVLLLPEEGHLLQIKRTELIARCVLAMVADSPETCREL